MELFPQTWSTPRRRFKLKQKTSASDLAHGKWLIIESAQWKNNFHLFGFLTLFPYLVSASLRWTWVSWACPWPSNRCLRCLPGARDWSVSRRRAVRTWRSRPVKTECSSPPVEGQSWVCVWLSERVNAKFKVSGWSTHRHCYLSFAWGGWEEMLLTAGVSEDKERGLFLESAKNDFLFLHEFITCSGWPRKNTIKWENQQFHRIIEYIAF